MGAQKYRADYSEQNPDGSVSWYSKWIGGPSLAKIANCLCEDGERRTVYIQGENDSFFSTPALVRVKGKDIRGYLTTLDFGKHDSAWVFVSKKITSEYRMCLNWMARKDQFYSARNKLESYAFQGYPYPTEYYHYEQ